MEMNVTTMCGTLIMCANLLSVPTEEVTVQSTYNLYETQSYSELMNTVEEFQYEIEQQRLEQQRLYQQEQRLAQQFNGVNLSNLLHVSNISEDEMKSLLKDTMLYDVAHVYVQAEKEFNVNAIILASISALESGWGTSRRALIDGNLFGRDVIEPTSVGKIYKTTENTIIDAQSISILDTAQHLRDNYLSEDGVYYNGYSIQAVNIKYCVNSTNQPTWATKVSDIANRLVKDYYNLPKIDQK